MVLAGHRRMSMAEAGEKMKRRLRAGLEAPCHCDLRAGLRIDTTTDQLKHYSRLHQFFLRPTDWPLAETIV
jgi:hypothetical protein